MVSADTAPQRLGRSTSRFLSSMRVPVERGTTLVIPGTDHAGGRMTLGPANSETSVFLRPAAILTASARLWSRAIFLVLERFDTKCPSTHLGFSFAGENNKRGIRV